MENKSVIIIGAGMMKMEEGKNRKTSNLFIFNELSWQR
jgi:hypothetical protein